jgi:hypothetical protein
MLSRNHFYLLVVSLVIASCNNSDKNAAAIADTLQKDSSAYIEQSIRVPMAKQNDIIDTLNALPFVKESNRYLDSLSNHTRSIAYIIDTTEKEYNVTAGYNGAERFETYYNFTINKKTREIKVQDVISGDMVTPKEFEKLRKADK